MLQSIKNTNTIAFNFNKEVVNSYHSRFYIPKKYRIENDEISEMLLSFKDSKGRGISYFEPIVISSINDILLKDNQFDIVVRALSSIEVSNSKSNPLDKVCLLISKLTGSRYDKELLMKSRFTTPLKSLGRNARVLEMLDVYKINATTNIKDKSILIVDDVFTTGTTLNSIVKALKLFEPSVNIYTYCLCKTTDISSLNIQYYNTTENNSEKVLLSISARKLIGGNKLLFVNGDIYVGDIFEGKMHGKRELTLIDGVYTGQFNYDQMHGKGKAIWNDGNTYIGDFYENKMHGKGKAIWINGDVYEGDFVDDQMHGSGKLAWSNGAIYEGDFVKNIRKGIGRITYGKDLIYEGGFNDNKKNGIGYFLLANGNIYVGEFLNDQMHGKGELTMSNGVIYEGAFKNSQMTGKGKKTYLDGTIYEGEFDNGKYLGNFSSKKEIIDNTKKQIVSENKNDIGLIYSFIVIILLLWLISFIF